jgi:hypothetical protein
MGKDVVSFLSWAAEPEMEERKLVCFLLLTHQMILLASFNISNEIKISDFLNTLILLADGI